MAQANTTSPYGPPGNATVKISWLRVVYIMPIFLLLFIGAIKNDTSTFDASVFWGAFQNSPIVTAVKIHMIGVYGLLAVFFLLASILARVIKPRLTAATLSFSAIYLWAAFRVLPFDGGFAAKLLVSFCAMVLIQSYLFALLSRGCDVVALILRAFYWFAAVLILLNLQEIVAGYGYVPSFPRFFGTSSHPNFLGVQMAVCCLTIAGGSLSKKFLTYTSRVALFIAGLTIMVATGSRTALVVFMVGMTTQLALTLRASVFLVSTLMIVLIAIALSFAADVSFFSSDVYDRGGIDTRSQAWSVLISAVASAPVLGLGHFPQYSENSLLRGWATFGIIYPALFLLTLANFAKRVLVNLHTPLLRRNASLVAIFSGLTAGSMLEGYLVDANSFALTSWLVCLATASLDLARSGTKNLHRPNQFNQRTQISSFQRRLANRSNNEGR